MGLRRKGRELALQALYQQEITADHSDQALRMFWHHFDTTDAVKEFALTLVHGVAERRDEIDRLIEKASANWRLDRLSKIDVNVIRLATYELLATPSVPASVVINEAIEIARRFGTQDSTAFVNGVLDQIAAELGVKDAGRDAAAAVESEE
ncbi:MAG TPA: transcription antitermination factor NusB [Candidatus Binatia bacterium]|nr:transcription antitermination factor NusB [Candidatus Binatia bacterium]